MQAVDLTFTNYHKMHTVFMSNMTVQSPDLIQMDFINTAGAVILKQCAGKM